MEKYFQPLGDSKSRNGVVICGRYLFLGTVRKTKLLIVYFPKLGILRLKIMLIFFSKTSVLMSFGLV